MQGSAIRKLKPSFSLSILRSLDLLYSSAARTIGSYKLRLNNAAAVCVVASSKGYPDEYEVGKVITGLENENCGDESVSFRFKKG